MSEPGAGDTRLVSRDAAAGTRPSAIRRWYFDEFEVDLQRGSLSRCGEPIALRPKSFAVLQYLLEHAGQLVSRDELLAVVWPGLVVTDDSIAQCLIELRRAIDDADRTKIRTVPRRGLIFDLPVRLEEATSPAPPPWHRQAPRRRWVLVTVTSLAVAALLLWAAYGPGVPGPLAGAGDAAPAARSIAVLRFADLSAAGDQAWLADGLSEEIMHRLTQSPSLRVIARASSLAVERQSVASIAKQLRVSHILEGSLRRNGDTMRVTAQLIDASTSLRLWSKTYDRKLVDILALQEEIAGAIAESLEAELGDARVGPDIDPEAHALFLEGRYFYFRNAEGDEARARQRLEQAVAISPGFARAWATLSGLAGRRSYDALRSNDLTIDRDSWRGAQRHAIEQALVYGPELPEIQIRAARYFYSIGDRVRSREHFETARSLDPDHWLLQMALASDLRMTGRVEAAIPVIRRVIRSDPLNLTLRDNLVGFLVQSRQFEAAQEELDRVLELASFPSGRSHELNAKISLVQILRGDFGAAEQSITSLPNGLERTQLLALNRYATGRRSEADAVLAQLAGEARTDWATLYVAEVHAFRGDGAAAMDWLSRIASNPGCAHHGLAPLVAVYYSPLLAKLEDRPDWQALRADLLQAMKSCSFGLGNDAEQLAVALL